MLAEWLANAKPCLHARGAERILGNSTKEGTIIPYHQLGDVPLNPFGLQASFIFDGSQHGEQLGRDLLLSLVVEGQPQKPVPYNRVFITADEHRHLRCIGCAASKCSHILQLQSLCAEAEERNEAIIYLDEFSVRPNDWALPQQGQLPNISSLPKSKAKFAPGYTSAVLQGRANGSLGE